MENNSSSSYVKCLSLILVYTLIQKVLIPNPQLASIFLAIFFLYATNRIIWNPEKIIKSTFILFSMLFIIIVNNFPTKNNFERDILPSKLVVNKEKFNIFLLETDKSRKFLDYKQMCSIESAAFNNPKADVHTVSLGAKLDSNLLKKYPNIKFTVADESEVFNNTPLMAWWLSHEKELLKSHYWIHDLSDAMRVALLYKYGGYYSDLDTITIRELTSLVQRNGLGYITEFSKPSLGNGVLVFGKNHSFLQHVIADFSQNYKANEWGHNGPKLFMRSLKAYCKTENIYEELTSSTRKCDVELFPESFFYPINWENVKKLFLKNGLIDIYSFKDTYSVHFYGKFSQQFAVKYNDFSLYEFFANKNCPFVYSILEQNLVSKI
ncbi:lactosylceramide 4-alpha-galactosyltransferase-like [Brachionus plicatilis]|uniref:Lactosylceramide 4-alpha-galactosyltransferase-like n=1 Tax=Brachionus plicatilis TaxID=10195 RepID=A0A3M7T395_BRAPC|nr:lactosylceramide 4-alpha-galactosyltransferase-like [Brachionus plicatilis]